MASEPMTATKANAAAIATAAGGAVTWVVLYLLGDGLGIEVLQGHVQEILTAAVAIVAARVGTYMAPANRPK